MKIFSRFILETIVDSKYNGKKLKQNDFANVLGISKQAFYWKMQKDSFSLKDIIIICDFLNYDVAILDRETGKTEYLLKKEP